MRLAIALTFAAVCGPALAGQSVEDRCTARSASESRRISLKSGGSNIRVRDGIFILRASDQSAPFDHPFDLAGRTLRFRRRNASTFTVTNEALAYDNATGSRQNTGDAFQLPFAFPFFDRTLRAVYLSRFNAIHGDAPDTNAVDQYGADELAALRHAVIAPLLTTSSASGNGADVWVRTASDRVVITWISNATTVQATLFSSGDITFAYKQVNLNAGAVVVSAGRDALTTTSSRSTNDGFDDVRPSLDIESASVAQLGDIGLIEFRMTLREAPDTSGLGATEYLRYDVLAGDARITYALFGDGSEDYQVPVWGETLRNPAARVEGRTIVLDVLPAFLGLSGATPVQFQASLNGPAADTATLTFTFEPARREPLMQFSSVASAIDVSTFAAEAFTLPVFDPFGAWDEVRAAYAIDQRQIDSVAFYQNFTTDIVFYAGAYSTGGNPGVDGITLRRAVSTALPRSPALLHMNRIGFLKNADLKSATRVLMHEFGHHWLFRTAIHEDGANTQVLNPAGAHPAQYVDTRAAFTVYDTDDASVMGGGHFDQSSGTFRSSKYSAYGYSWLDLYLMGLASRDEVQPSFYIANSAPELGQAYFPPELTTFRGERRAVAIQQVIDAMGPRSPAWPATQRDFTVLFVIVDRSSQPLSEEDFARVRSYRDSFVQKFAIATDFRASVKTTPSVPRRRSVSSQ